MIEEGNKHQGCEFFKNKNKMIDTNRERERKTLGKEKVYYIERQ